MSRQDPPKAVRIDSWSFDGSWPASRPGIPMLGIFLILLGLFLGAGQLFSQAQLGASAFFLAVGLVLVIVGVRDHSDLALYVGVFILALSLSDVLHSLNVIRGAGWGTLFLGLGVMAIALIRSTAGRRWGWALGIGVLLALWGGSDVAASYADFPTDRLFGPLLVILLGVYIVTRSRFGRRV
jgi:hypothetical protein